MTLIVKNLNYSQDQRALLPNFENYLGAAGLFSNKTLKKVYFDFSIIRSDENRRQNNDT